MVSQSLRRSVSAARPGSLRNLFRIVAACIVLLLPGAAWASDTSVVELYPGPGVDTYKSNLYRVQVQNGTQWQDSYTYKVARKAVIATFQTADGSDPSVNFTTFGTSAPVMVRVSKVKGQIHSIEVSPKSKAISAILTNGVAEFQLKPWEKAWVVIDRDEHNPLFVYADPPKPAVPKNAIYFGPGVHDIGMGRKVGSGKTVYLDGGAWVTGTFDLTDQSNVTITGPGVLSGEKMPYESIKGTSRASRLQFVMIFGDGSPAMHDNRLERITIVNSPHFNVAEAVDYIGGVKLLSPWVYSTDGFHLLGHPGTTSILEHCFAFVGDDVLFPRENNKGNLEYRDSFLSTTNNSVFQITYWGQKLNYPYTAYIHDIDIKNFLVKNNSAVFKASINGTQETGTKNMTFEDIRIEGDLICPLLLIENRPYFWPDQTTKPETSLGNTYNMVFRNISVSGKAGVKSSLLGLNEKNGHHDYLFENVSIHGETLSEKNYSKYITLNPYVWNIRFVDKPNAK